jgi:hypothetical protein
VNAGLRRRYLLRLHAVLLLLWTFFCGVLATKALLALGAEAMWLRYGISVAVSYLAFLLGVRAWLIYVDYWSLARRREQRTDGSLDFPGGNSGASSHAVADPLGGGGHFAGGGASGHYEVDSGLDLHMDLPPVGSVDPGPIADGASGVLDSVSSLGDGVAAGEGCVIPILVGVLIALLIWALVLIVDAAPVLLVDAAFDALLAAGLIRSLRREQRSAVSSTLRATFLPFLIVLATAIGLGAVAQNRYPAARTLPDVVKALRDYVHRNDP